jgi:small subunit ribosomal protein SAe
MSQVPPVLTLQESDVKAMLACQVHIGSENLDASMGRYVFKRNDKGIHIIDLRKTWEKLVLAARIIVAIENSKDICVVALSPAGQPSPAQRAVLKFAQYVKCRSIAGRITPGTFTNQRQTQYMEPRLLVTSDPRFDHQPILEASYVNIPVVSFANTHHNLRGVDVAIPCNTSGKNSIALMYWMLAREVLRLREEVKREQEWNVMVDMFVYREPEEAEKQATGEEGGWDKGFSAGSGWANPPATSDQWEGAEGEPVADEYAAHAEEWAGQDQWAGDAVPAATTGEWGDETAETWGEEGNW